MGQPTVYLVQTDDVATIEAAGPRHPALGRLFDIGTSAALAGIDSERAYAALAELLQGEPAGLFSLEHARWDGAAVPTEAERAINAAAESSGVFVLLCGRPAQLPLALAAGPRLPSMGRTAPADPATLLRSVRFAAGASELDGSLFAEPAFDGAAEEARLRERLRQLYGDE
ncbi:MAG: hypothetical protein ACR2N4_11575 [Jatrophihabitans sp.]